MNDYPIPDILISNLSQTILDLLEVASRYYENPVANIMKLMEQLIDVPSKPFIKAGMNELALLGILEEKRISNLGKLIMDTGISPPGLAKSYVYAQILGLESKVLPYITLMFK